MLIQTSEITQNKLSVGLDETDKINIQVCLENEFYRDIKLYLLRHKHTHVKGAINMTIFTFYQTTFRSHFVKDEL